jgi:hypothetical protein
MPPDPLLIANLPSEGEPPRDDLPTWVKVVFLLGVVLAGIFAVAAATPNYQRPQCWHGMEIGSDQRC